MPDIVTRPLRSDAPRAAPIPPTPAPAATATTAAASETPRQADHVAPTSHGPVEKVPLALTAKSAVSIKDLLFKGPRITGGRNGDLAKTWEPDVVLLILARFQAKPGVADLSPAELGRALERGLQLTDDVVKSAARFMGAPADALRSWITRRPWTQMARVDPMPARDVDEWAKRIAAWVKIRDGSYRVAAPVDLDAEIAKAKLRPKAVSLMHHWAKAIVGADELLAQHENADTTTARDGQAGFVLATTGANDFAALRFATATNLRFWRDGYFRMLNGSSRDQRTTSYYPQTENYMDLITSSGEPVVFLIPPNLGVGRYPVTGGELKWLLERPERMRNVTFVFGAYQ